MESKIGYQKVVIEGNHFYILYRYALTHLTSDTILSSTGINICSMQDWIRESQQGFNQSNLASQCTYR